VARGYNPRIIEELAGQIETFGRYGFNKSHSVAYSVISYQTAWLKAHYPAEFMAALLSSSIGDTDSVVKFINEAREVGIEVLRRRQRIRLQVHGDRRKANPLRPGAIRNVGRSAIDSILAARRERSFSSFYDLCDRVDLQRCNKRVFEALIASGALDNVGGHRAQYWAVLDSAIQEASLKQQEEAVGQFSLLGGNDDVASVRAPRVLPNLAPPEESERLTREKEIRILYLRHPLEPFRMGAGAGHAPCRARIDRSVSLARRGGHGGQKTDQQAVGGGIRAVDSRGFFGIFQFWSFPKRGRGSGKDRHSSLLKELLARDQDVENPTFIVSR
jgi:DNA polymerase-3 subunit alpha